MAITTKISPDILQTWLDFKQDQTDQSLRNRLIERYFPLVKYNAERVWAKLPEGVDLNDLISAGVFGLMDAIEAFDLERGVKFETYCVPRIRGAMLDELRTMDWVPRLVRSKASKLEAARKKVEAEVGRPPKDEEIALKMDLTSKEFDKLKNDANAVNLVSLKKKWYETDSYKDVREIDILEDIKGRPHHLHSEARSDEAGDQRSEPKRTPHHHPLLLRGTDDEGNRLNTRPLGIAS